MKNLLQDKRVLIGAAVVVLVLGIGYFYYQYSNAEGEFQAGSCSASTVGQCCGAKGTCVAVVSNNTTSYRCDRTEVCGTLNELE